MSISSADLSESEVQIIHLLRGHGIESRWRLEIERRPDGYWRVDEYLQVGSEIMDTLGEGSTFDDAWSGRGAVDS